VTSFRALAYQLQLAARDVRRNGVLSIGVMVCLALGTGLWNAAVEVYLRTYGPAPALPSSLHQVQLPHRTTLSRSLQKSLAAFAAAVGPTQVTFPEYQLLAASGVPTRQTGTLRSHLLVADPTLPASPPRTVAARFVNADFFALFSVPLRSGRGFDREEDARGDPVIVLGAPLARDLFDGDDGVGRSLVIEGQRFRVIGQAARDQPYRPTWDIGTQGGDQDALYLPLAWFQRLLARPDAPAFQSPVGSSFDQLLASDAIFVAYWNELPTPAHQAAYRAHLDRTFGARGIAAQLRAYPEWLRAFPSPDSGISFLAMLTALVLVGACCNITRLLLAKALARRAELSIHRALGATRGALFTRQICEGILLALPAALLGVALALPVHAIFNHLVRDSDVPLRITGLGFVLTAAPAVLTGVAAALFPAWRVARTEPAFNRHRGLG
jgi:putative ABC transport system permease protein